jgi:hypothetical protein
MPKLSEMIGEVILAYVPIFDKVKFQELKLHAVEPSGIWVESQSMINTVLEHAGVSSAPKTLIFFLPFSQIGYILSALDFPSLSEKSLL